MNSTTLSPQLSAVRNNSKRFKKYGPWAVVTGASSGIGKEFAKTLASEGFDLVIAARRIERLNDIAADLSERHGVIVRTVQADLSTSDGIEAIEKAAADIEIGLVVSNAGDASPGAFLKNSLEAQMLTTNLNVLANVQLAHSLGGRLVEQGHGGLIMTGSTSAFGGIPYLANYAATKAFVGTFAEGLNAEWKKHGVDVLVLHPGPTKTEMVEQMKGADFSRVPTAWMTPEAVVYKALKGLGRKTIVVPGFPNKMMRFVTTRLTTRRGLTRIWGALMGKVTDDDMK